MAQRAGFGPDEAYLTAYSSQYTGDNRVQYRINEGVDGDFENCVSQATVPTEPESGIRRVYPLYHFVPGGRDELFLTSARRRLSP